MDKDFNTFFLYATYFHDSTAFSDFQVKILSFFVHVCFLYWNSYYTYQTVTSKSIDHMMLFMDYSVLRLSSAITPHGAYQIHKFCAYRIDPCQVFYLPVFCVETVSANCIFPLCLVFIPYELLVSVFFSGEAALLQNEPSSQWNLNEEVDAWTKSGCPSDGNRIDTIRTKYQDSCQGT